jgi:hypothetical protein
MKDDDRPRQLSLLKGPRQKGTLPPTPLEFAVHCSLSDLLRISLNRGWVFFHPPNGGERPHLVRKDGRIVSVEGGRLQRMGAKKGVSDFILIGPPNGRVHALELKREGEKPSEDQLRFLDDIRQAGGVAEWADTFDKALAFFKAWGAVR